jgi:hypothetical protein
MNRTRTLIVALCFSCAALFSSTFSARVPKTVVYKVGVMNRKFTPPEPYDWRDAKAHALIADMAPRTLPLPVQVGPRRTLR